MTATKSINNLYLSEHLKTDRADRMVEILLNVGIGVVKWVRQSTKDPGIEYRFSSTGVMFVVAKEYDLITTAYIVNSKKVSAIFEGNAPKELWKKVLENEKKGLTHNQGYAIIALERNERMLKMFRKWYTVEWTYKDEDGNYRTPRRNYDTEEEANHKIFELSHTKGVEDIYKTTHEHWKIRG